MKTAAKLLAVAALGAVLLSLTGCVGIQADPNSNLPQNSPAAWENTTFGVAI